MSRQPAQQQEEIEAFVTLVDILRQRPNAELVEAVRQAMREEDAARREQDRPSTRGDLQAMQGDLQAMQGDLQAMRGDLQALCRVFVSLLDLPRVANSPEVQVVRTLASSGTQLLAGEATSSSSSSPSSSLGLHLETTGRPPRSTYRGARVPAWPGLERRTMSHFGRYPDCLPAILCRHLQGLNGDRQRGWEPEECRNQVADFAVRDDPRLHGLFGSQPPRAWAEQVRAAQPLDDRFLQVWSLLVEQRVEFWADGEVVVFNAEGNNQPPLSVVFDRNTFWVLDPEQDRRS